MDVQQQNVDGSLLSHSKIEHCKWRGMTMLHKASKVDQTKSVSRVEGRERERGNHMQHKQNQRYRLTPYGNTLGRKIITKYN